MGMFSLFFDSVSLQAHVFNRQVRSPAALPASLPISVPFSFLLQAFLYSCNKFVFHCKDLGGNVVGEEMETKRRGNFNSISTQSQGLIVFDGCSVQYVIVI